jgi:hypothetical protein
MSGRKAAGGSGGGTEPDPKKRRLLDAGGPIEDDETARQKMRDAEVYERRNRETRGEYVGFDPDNVRDVKSYHPRDADARVSNAVTPMGYFAKKGDLPMMRWLYVNGADTRDEQLPTWYPMISAAVNGHLHVSKWLFQHGAAGDINRRSRSGVTPLSAIFHESGKRELSRWMILRGALCKDDGTGDLDVNLVRSSLNCFADSVAERRRLFEWAKEHHQSRSSLKTFLMGTLPAPEYSATQLRNALLARICSEEVVDMILRHTTPDQHRLFWVDLFAHRVCPLVVFSGKSAIFELIGEYVGIMRGREARIIRQLTEPLGFRWRQHANRFI